MRIGLGLDLAVQTGWAVTVPGRALPLHGSRRLAPLGINDEGAHYVALNDWLEELHAVHQFGVALYEAPIIMANHSQRAGLITFGLAATVSQFCYRRGVECLYANVSTIRKAVLGTGQGKTGKTNAMTYCLQAGLTPYDDNVADAVVAYEYLRLWQKENGR